MADACSVWYLAFQRAPPQRCVASSSVPISANLTTDLREAQYFPEASPIQLHYTWIKRTALPSGTDSLFRFQYCFVQHAATTAWSGPQSAFETVSVKVPTYALVKKLATERASLRLALYHAEEPLSESASEEEVFKTLSFSVDRIWAKDGANICPLISIPLTILDDKASRPPQPGLPTRANDTVRILTDAAAGWTVNVRESSGYELDKHIWDASHLLGSYLSRSLSLQPPNQPEWVQRLLAHDSQEIFRVIELGSGTGCTALSLAAMVALLSRRLSIHATDLESADEILRQNRADNFIEHDQLPVHISALDWTLSKKDIEAWLQDHLHGAVPDLILISDCTYNPDYFVPLANVIAIIASASTTVLLSKKHRHADEEQLWGRLADAALEATLVLGQDPSGEDYHGMGLYSIAHKQAPPPINA